MRAHTAGGAPSLRLRPAQASVRIGGQGINGRFSRRPSAVSDDVIAELWPPPPVMPAHVVEHNKALADRLAGKLVLAPLTRGGNLPFRRLCCDFGCEVTMSEMAFARQLLKGDKVERARLQKADNEHTFGFQMATNVIDEGIGAAKLAYESGASWVDLNCGCPIYEATKRGLGAALLRKPSKLARLVAGIAAGSPLPLTVKIRTGENEKKINVEEVVALLQGAGAAAVTVHGRTMEQRYKKPADWALINRVAAAASVPVLGNGDLLTHYEVTRRRADHEAQPHAAAAAVHALMVGRGALVKPWLWEEVKLGRELCLTEADRVGVYRRLVSHMKDHFGDDARGRRSAWYFLPWHFSFFHRYRHFPEQLYAAASAQHPLILSRADLADPLLGESRQSLRPLQRLLRCEHETAHQRIADALWEADSDGHALQLLEALAVEHVEAWEAECRAPAAGGRDDRDGGRGEDREDGTKERRRDGGGGRKGERDSAGRSKEPEAAAEQAANTGVAADTAQGQTAPPAAA